jgi:hypothetical protein
MIFDLINVIDLGEKPQVVQTPRFKQKDLQQVDKKLIRDLPSNKNILKKILYGQIRTAYFTSNVPK